MTASLWQVVGGADKGGILVREKCDLKSALLQERLGTQSIVEELEIIGERLHFRKVSGSGPEVGWVSLKLKDKRLLLRSGSPYSGNSRTRSTAFSAESSPPSAHSSPDVEAQSAMPGEKNLFQQRIAPDAKVKISGLSSKDHVQYNGKNGAIRGFDAITGRYLVKVVILNQSLSVGEKSDKQILLNLKFENLELHQDQVERDKVLNGDEIVLLGAGDAKRKLYEVKLDLQYWYDKAIERVFDAKNDFEVLDLAVKMIDDMSSLKRQYRKISLAVHPDKNQHPQATDAFRKVYGAFETLMDMRQQRRLLWILGKPHDSEESVTFDEEEEDELFQWWWEATVPQIEKQVAEFEGQRLDDFGAMWISDGLGGRVEDVQWIGLETAKRLHNEGQAIFLDVRDRFDYATGHICDAYSIPLPEVINHGLVNVLLGADENLIGKMLRNRKIPIIIYSEVATPFSRCRAFCRWLLRAGHATLKAERLRRLRGGMFGWKHKQGPVARPLADQSCELENVTQNIQYVLDGTGDAESLQAAGAIDAN